MFNLGKSEQTNYFCFYSQTTFSFYPVQLWLGGKEGLEKNSRPHAAWPTLFFSHPRRGTKPGHACKTTDIRVGIKAGNLFYWPIQSSTAQHELAMTPDQSIQGMRKKEIKYQRDYIKLEGLWTLRVCRLVCFYFNIYSIYLNIDCATVYAYLFCKKFFPYTRKLSFWKLLKTVHLPERDKTVFPSFQSATSGTEA